MHFRFGSFNLMNMGHSAIGKDGITKREFGKIAEIILAEQFDVVAFQEILSQGYALEYLVRHLLPGWNLKWAEPKESSDSSKIKDKRGEGYAFVWNTTTVALASSVTENGMRIYEPRIVNEALRYDASMFARTPYFARFVPVNGGFFEFRLINVHLHFGDNSRYEIDRRKEEFNFLIDRIYPSISMERRYGNNREAYTIVMGDYNLNLFRPRGEAEARMNKNTYIEECHTIGKQTIATVQDALTTLKSSVADENTMDDNPNRGYSQNYDHFSFEIGRFDEEKIQYKCSRVDAVREYCHDDFEVYRAEISDHIPIALEITMNE